jgi:hypothetical protein
MRPEKVLQHIDKQVIEQISLGQRWEDILFNLSCNVKRYKKRQGYIQVSEKYLINNWDRIEWKKRLTTMLVIQSIRRIDDIKWIIENHKSFPRYGSSKMYKMLSLKDKLKFNYSSSSDDSQIVSNS